MRKAWFCYEAGSSGPVPVIHYDSLPNAKNSLNPKILQSFPVPDNMFYDMGEMEGQSIYVDEVNASFSSLCIQFPYTGNEYNTEKTFNLDHKEAAE